MKLDTHSDWPSTIVLASHNPGKLKEFEALLNTPAKRSSHPERAITLISQSTLNVPQAEEPHLTFMENALAKARHASRFTGLPALADDSGLCIPALQGAPGVYSARFASLANTSDQERWGFPAHTGIDAANALRLMEAMAPHTDRRAYYVCVLAFVLHADDPEPLFTCARWWGEIAQTEAGIGGFGYDAVFYIPDLHQTAAQLDAPTKNIYSHRARACTQWKAALQERFCPAL